MDVLHQSKQQQQQQEQREQAGVEKAGEGTLQEAEEELTHVDNLLRAQVRALVAVGVYHIHNLEEEGMYT
jgi:hypothetical protein